MVQLTFDLPHETRLGAGDFMPDPSNAAALSAIQSWPDWPSPVLVISGPPASGKTHLTQIWAARANAAIINGATIGSLPPPERTIIALDNADQLADQAGLFHYYNHAVNNEGALLLTGQQPPALWQTSLPDLGSRLRAAQHLMIEPPSDELLAVLLLKHLSDRQLTLDEPVMAFLQKRLPRSAAAMASAADQLDRLSLARQRPITLAIAREIIEALEKE